MKRSRIRKVLCESQQNVEGWVFVLQKNNEQEHPVLFFKISADDKWVQMSGMFNSFTEALASYRNLMNENEKWRDLLKIGKARVNINFPYIDCKVIEYKEVNH